MVDRCKRGYLIYVWVVVVMAGFPDEVIPQLRSKLLVLKFYLVSESPGSLVK